MKHTPSLCQHFGAAATRPHWCTGHTAAAFDLSSLDIPSKDFFNFKSTLIEKGLEDKALRPRRDPYEPLTKPSRRYPGTSPLFGDETASDAFWAAKLPRIPEWPEGMTIEQYLASKREGSEHLKLRSVLDDYYATAEARRAARDAEFDAAMKRLQPDHQDLRLIERHDDDLIRLKEMRIDTRPKEIDGDRPPKKPVRPFRL